MNEYIQALENLKNVLDRQVIDFQKNVAQAGQLLNETLTLARRDRFFEDVDKAYQEEKDHIAEGRMEQEMLDNGEIRYEA